MTSTGSHTDGILACLLDLAAGTVSSTASVGQPVCGGEPQKRPHRAQLVLHRLRLVAGQRRDERADHRAVQPGQTAAPADEREELPGDRAIRPDRRDRATIRPQPRLKPARGRLPARRSACSRSGSSGAAPTRGPRSRRASPRPGTRTRRSLSACRPAPSQRNRRTPHRPRPSRHPARTPARRATRNTAPDAASSRGTRPASTACSPGAPTRHPTRTPAQKQQPSRSPPITNDRAPRPSRVTRASPALCAALDRQPRSLRELQASAAHNPALLIWGIGFAAARERLSPLCVRPVGRSMEAPSGAR